MGLSCSRSKYGPAVTGDDVFWLESPQVKIGEDRDIRARYKITQSSLGEGSCSTVWVAVDRATKDAVAVKQCSKELVTQRLRQDESRVSEVQVLVTLGQHVPQQSLTGVPRLLATYEDESHLYLVQTIFYGGDLYDHIGGWNGFCERDASSIVKALLETVVQLHSRRVVHLDINPTNVVFPTADTTSPPHLVDFGSAAVLPDDNTVRDPLRCCRPSFFSAPESVSGYCDTAADVWSVGALTFVMVGGVHPEQTLPHVDVSGNPTWLKLQGGHTDCLPDNTSSSLEDFLLKTLTPERGSRLSAQEALLHPWISFPDLLARAPLGPSVAKCQKLSITRGGPGAAAKYYIQENRMKIPQTELRRCGTGEGELKWKAVGAVTTTLDEFERSESRKKVCVEVREQPSPRRRSRHNSKEYVSFSPGKRSASVSGRNTPRRGVAVEAAGGLSKQQQQQANGGVSPKRRVGRPAGSKSCGSERVSPSLARADYMAQTRSSSSPMPRRPSTAPHKPS